MDCSGDCAGAVAIADAGGGACWWCMKKRPSSTSLAVTRRYNLRFDALSFQKVKVQAKAT
jgi:hypothetical protein